MNRAETAVATFKSGFNCSQAVLSVFCEEPGLDRETSARIACGFGGGIGHLGETCGAVTGAVMAMGLKRGMSVKGSTYKSNMVVYALAGELAREFTSRNRSIKCRDLLGFDISDKEAYDEARRKGTFYSVCPKYVSDAVEILENLLLLHS
jgi:C_GCAxxG_C_C family probable redox protein